MCVRFRTTFSTLTKSGMLRSMITIGAICIIANAALRGANNPPNPTCRRRGYALSRRAIRMTRPAPDADRWAVSLMNHKQWLKDFKHCKYKFVDAQGVDRATGHHGNILCCETGLVFRCMYTKCPIIRRAAQQGVQLTAAGVKTEDIYYSHRGRGPGIAREVYRNNGNVRMEYKADPSDFRWIQFEITEGALASKSCGWRKRASGRCGQSVIRRPMTG